MALRAPFTKDEEDELALFLAMNPGPRNGKVLYQEFARAHPTHSWQSWRAHYLSDTLKMDAVIRRINRQLRTKSARTDNRRPPSRAISPEVELMPVEDTQKQKGKAKAPPAEVIEIDCGLDALQTSPRALSAGQEDFILRRIPNEPKKISKQSYNLIHQPFLSPKKLQLNALNTQVPVITMSREEEKSFFDFVSSYPEGDLRLCLKFYENYHLKINKYSPAEYQAYYLVHHDKVKNASSRRLDSMEVDVVSDVDVNSPQLLNTVQEIDLANHSDHDGHENGVAKHIDDGVEEIGLANHFVDSGKEDAVANHLDDGHLLIADNQQTNAPQESAIETPETDTLSISTGSEDDLDLEYILTCDNHSELANTTGIPLNLLQSLLKLKENPFHCLTDKSSDSANQNHLQELQGEPRGDGALIDTCDPVTNNHLPCPEKPSSQHSNDFSDREELDKNSAPTSMPNSVKEPPLLSPDNEGPRLNELSLPQENQQETHGNESSLIEMPVEGYNLALPENEKPVEVQPNPTANGGSMEISDSKEDHRSLSLKTESQKQSNLSNPTGSEQELHASAKDNHLPLVLPVNEAPRHVNGESQRMEEAQENTVDIVKRKRSYSSSESSSNQDNVTSTVTESSSSSMHETSHNTSIKPVGHINDQPQSLGARSVPHEHRVNVLKRNLSNGERRSNSPYSSHQHEATSTGGESALPPLEMISRKSSFKPVGAPSSVEEAVELLSIFLADFSDFYTPPEAVNLFQQCGDWALMFEVATLKKAEKEMKEASKDTDVTLSTDQFNDRDMVDQEYSLKIQSLLWTPEEDELVLKAGSSQINTIPEVRAKFHQLAIKRGTQAIKNRRAFLISIHQ